MGVFVGTKAEYELQRQRAAERRRQLERMTSVYGDLPNGDPPLNQPNEPRRWPQQPQQPQQPQTDPWAGMREVTSRPDPWDMMRQQTQQQQAAPAAEAPPGLLSRLTAPENRDAMLGLAGGLLNAGRWSTMPVSWGEALGEGVAGYQKGKLTSEQRKLIEKEQKRKDDEAKREQARLDNWQKLVGGEGGADLSNLTDTQRALLASMTPEQGAQMLMAQTTRGAGGVELINLETPDGKVVTMRRNDPQIDSLIRAGAREVGVGAGRDSAREAQIARLESTGVPREVAIGIADGRLVIGNDDTGRPIVLDKSTGKPWTGVPVSDQLGGETMPPAPAVGPTNPSGAPVPPSAPSAARGSIVYGDLPPVSGGTPGLPQPSIDPNVDPRDATGVGGTISSIINPITDWLTDKAVDPGNMAATTALDSLATRTRAMLQDAIPGRPTNYTLELMDPYIVDANSFGLGADKAMSKFKQTAKILTTERERLRNEVLAYPERWTPDEVRQGQRAFDNMGALLADYELLISKFPGANGAKTPAAGPIDPAQFDR